MKKLARNCKRLAIMPAEKLRDLPLEAKQESERFYRSQESEKSLPKDKPVIKAKSKIFRIFGK